MPGSNKKFTDRDLTWLYGNLLNHYAQLAPNSYDIHTVYHQMQASVHGTLSNYGVFKDLADVEKAKVVKAFDTIFRALPMYRGLAPLEQNAFNHQPLANPSVVYVYRNYNNNSSLYDWLLLNSLLHNCNHSAHPPGRFPGGMSIPSGNHHNHKDKSTSGELIALLVVIALAAFAAALAFIAMYYMFSEFLNSVERFYYNEGWLLKAALMMASSLAFAASSFLITITFASMPIIALALAAGLNPAGLVITSVVLLTVIGAAVGTLAMDLLYDSIDKKLNKNSMILEIRCDSD